MCAASQVLRRADGPPTDRRPASSRPTVRCDTALGGHAAVGRRHSLLREVRVGRRRGEEAAAAGSHHAGAMPGHGLAVCRLAVYMMCVLCACLAVHACRRHPLTSRASRSHDYRHELRERLRSCAVPDRRRARLERAIIHCISLVSSDSSARSGCAGSCSEGGGFSLARSRRGWVRPNQLCFRLSLARHRSGLARNGPI